MRLTTSSTDSSVAASPAVLVAKADVLFGCAMGLKPCRHAYGVSSPALRSCWITADQSTETQSCDTQRAAYFPGSNCHRSGNHTGPYCFGATVAPCRAAYPISVTAPQLTLCPDTPPRRLHLAIASSQALAAECGACPGEPISPAIDENTLNKRKGTRSHAECSDTAPCTFGPYVVRKLTAL